MAPTARAVAGIVCLLLAWAGLAHWHTPEPAPVFEIGPDVVVSIQSRASGRFLTVHPDTGLLVATATTSAAAEARFRVVVLAEASVKALAIAAESAVDAAVTTNSGCRCSGFSNEHGLGRYCHPWESQTQMPWCYVDDLCKGGGARGSFGHRSEDCPPPWAPQPLYRLWSGCGQV